MQHAVFGLGYVGLSTAVWLCDQGHTVVGFDSEFEVLENIRNGSHLVDEPGITVRAQEYIKSGHLTLHTLRPDSSLRGKYSIDLVFIATHTPIHGSQLQSFESVFQFLAKEKIGYLGVVIKSTVVDLCIPKALENHGPVVFAPEFLRQGHAYRDTAAPSRVVLGSNDEHLLDTVESLYAATEAPIFKVTPETAILAKLASNSMLAIKVLVANELAEIINYSGANADINDIADIMGADPRIGNSHLRPSLGVGGACLPKDLHALSKIYDHTTDGELSLITSAYHIQSTRSPLDTLKAMHHRHSNSLGHDLMVIVGCGFKDGVTDTRGSPALRIYTTESRTVVVYAPNSNVTVLANQTLATTLEELKAAARNSTAALIINTSDTSVIAQVCDAVTVDMVYDPQNLLTPTVAALLLPSNVKYAPNATL